MDRSDDLRAVAAALGSPIVSVTTLAGGYSHETCLLTLADGPVVARFGGAAPAVEAAVMELARPHVPVPAVLLTSPATVLEFVPGTLLGTALATCTPDESAALGHEVGRVAAAVGAIELDRPGFFTGPQLATWDQPPWSQQLAGFAAGCMDKTERLDPATRAAWAALCERRAPELTAADQESRLAHGDLNPKNILVTRDSGGWRVAALLDWEFSYAGCPAADAANMLRFPEDSPAPYAEGFRSGFGLTPERERLGRVFDMFALSDLVTRPPGNPVADQAARLITQLVTEARA